MQRRLRRFHEALNRIYFLPASTPPAPPPPQPSPPDAAALDPGEDHSCFLDPTEIDGGGQEKVETSSSETESIGITKLTRAQRKRLRKKKLKEAAAESAAAQRRRIIGPERPPTCCLSKDGGSQNG